MGKNPECFGQSIVDGTTADNQLTDLHQARTLSGNLKRVINLQRHHRSEVEDLRRRSFVSQRMTRRRNADKTEAALKGTHHHHLTCNIVEGHAEQRRIARLQSKEVARDTGRGQHPALLHSHRLGSTRAATRLYL